MIVIVMAGQNCLPVSFVRAGYSVLVIILLCQTLCVEGIVHMQLVAPISQLHKLVLGDVLPCCGEEYQRRRVVNNRACFAKPAVIVRPVTTEDVAITVNFARRNGFQVRFLLCTVLLYSCLSLFNFR